jgi:hypothetical protein
MAETDLDALRKLFPRWLITSCGDERLKAVLGSYTLTTWDAASLEKAMREYEAGRIRA